MSCDYFRSPPIRRLSHLTEENSVCSIIASILASIAAIVFSLPFILIFALVLPAYLSVKWLLLLVHCNRRRLSGSGPESVRGNDSRWLGTEWRSSVIHAVLVFEAKEGVNVEHFRRLLLKRVIPLYPRLTQRLIFLPLLAGVGICWMTDAKFSIDEHVFSGPSMSTEKDLQDYVSKLVADGLPEDKSPWQLQVFQSFGRNQDTVVILRVHQSVADGTALMRLLCHSLADSQIVELPERPRSGSLAFCMNVFRACIVGPLTLLLWVFCSEEDCNILTHRSTWTGSVTVTWSASITLPKVVRIKQVTRSTVNCVLLSALAGALRRLLQGCGVTQPSDLKVVVPMDLRDQTSKAFTRTKLGNKTSSVIMPLPVAVEGCVPRLWATRRTLDSLRTSVDPVILYVATAALMSIGSASFARHLVNFFTDRASLQFSSLAGPTSEVLLEGQVLKGIYPILPAQANLGISITTITYADQVFVSVLAERALGPAAELILKYLEDQIDILWKLLLNRRVPGEQESPLLHSKTNLPDPIVREVDSKINLMQKKEHLGESKEKKSGKISTLKEEFSELVDEIKKRQSICEIENVDTLKRSRRRAFSCSNCKKPGYNLPRRLRHQSDQSVRDMQRKQVTTEKVREKNQVFQENSTDQNKARGSKDCVINITGTSKSRSPQRGSVKASRFFGKAENAPEKSLTFQRSKSEYLVDKQKRTNQALEGKSKKDKPKKFKKKFETDLNSEGPPSIIIHKTWAEEKKSSNEIEPENLTVRLLDMPTKYDRLGPNHQQSEPSKCIQQIEVHENKVFDQVLRLTYPFVEKEEKVEDSDESEIVGGVLI